jgi:hypothetical protein
MILRFGNVFMGQVKTQEKQWIETSVFVFIILLYAQSSRLVTDVTSIYFKLRHHRLKRKVEQHAILR